jgi:DNA-nicking Smr family endonuclease
VSWVRRVLRAAFPAGCPQLDLHGASVPEALESVARFLARAEQQGVDEVRIVCGKGRHSPGGVGVLRHAVPGWLDAHGYAGRYRREVDRDGRDGALRVELGR